MAAATGPIQLTGTILNEDSTPFNGAFILRLNRYASILESAGGPKGLSPAPIRVPVRNGAVVSPTQGVYGNDTLLGDTHYVAQLADTDGNILWTQNTQILGDTPFNLGTLTPYEIPTGSDILALASLQGIQGPPFNMRGAYDSTVTYAAGDGISYQGGTYVSAYGANLNHTPGTDGNWTLLLQGPGYGTTSQFARYTANGYVVAGSGISSADISGASGLTTASISATLDPRYIRNAITDYTYGIIAVSTGGGYVTDADIVILGDDGQRDTQVSTVSGNNILFIPFVYMAGGADFGEQTVTGIPTPYYGDSPTPKTYVDSAIATVNASITAVGTIATGSNGKFAHYSASNKALTPHTLVMADVTDADWASTNSDVLFRTLTVEPDGSDDSSFQIASGYSMQLSFSGNTMFAVYGESGQVFTYNNILDDGDGNMILAGQLVCQNFTAQGNTDMQGDVEIDGNLVCNSQFYCAGAVSDGSGYQISDGIPHAYGYTTQTVADSGAQGYFRQYEFTGAGTLQLSTGNGRGTQVLVINTSSSANVTITCTANISTKAGTSSTSYTLGPSQTQIFVRTVAGYFAIL